MKQDHEFRPQPLSHAKRPSARLEAPVPRIGLRRAICLLTGLAFAQAGAQSVPVTPDAPLPGHTTNVTTYHNDNQRTGWNNTESTLTVANVKSTSFGLQHTVALDDQVDAQPLVVASQAIANHGTHEVVYVATENNTVYALDASAGTSLISRNLGKPVPRGMLPGSCNNNATAVGINATPVLDLTTNTLFVVAYTLVNNVPTYHLHALDASTLADKAHSPVTITGSHALSNGTTYKFDPAASRQRPALIEANGNVYVGFGSFCDIHADRSRGWLLGWKADGTLKPLPSNQLNDRSATSTHSFFLSSIWMSGYGVAAEPTTGRLLFVTGNSDYASNTYNPPVNIEESVVSVAPDLSSVVDWFTPSGPTFGVVKLDGGDQDFGSGGVMVVPDAAAPTPLAVAAGKVGQMYLMNRSNLGKYTASGPDKVLGTFSIGKCYCGPSFFSGSDGVGRIVSSGASTVQVWKIVTSPKTTLQTQSGSFTSLTNGQRGGFMTSVSSNGKTAGTAIIWAVGRPVDSKPAYVRLYAFDASSTKSATAPLFSAVAGSWPYVHGDANIVPVVANGKVYVASYKALNIFGLNGQLAPVIAEAPVMQTPSAANQVFGIITQITGAQITLRTASGAQVQVDTSAAEQAHESVVLVVGDAVDVHGLPDAAGVVHATTILHADDSPALWTVD